MSSKNDVNCRLAIDMDDVITSIEHREATIGILGLGYVGLPLAIHFEDAGFDVVGYDIDRDRVANLEDGNSYVEDVSDAHLQTALDGGFYPTAEAADLERARVFILTVPTGLNGKEPDMSAIRGATSTVGQYAPNEPVLLICSSTLYPGATTEVIEPELVEADRSPGSDIFLAMVPERLSPGSELRLEDVPLVVGANDDTARTAARSVFDSIVPETVPVESTLTAEMAKLVENIYRQVNIGLVNELALFAERIGVDIWEVLAAADTKPSGFKKFHPGPGVGGHCIPVDPLFVSWKGSEVSASTELIEQAQDINNRMPSHVVETVKTVLEIRGTNLNEADITVFGLTYKPDVSDTRNSPSLTICEMLLNAGMSLTIVDPYISEINIDGNTYTPTSVPDLKRLKSNDLTLLLVDHEQFDWTPIIEASPVVVDTRNVAPTHTDTPIIKIGNNNGNESTYTSTDNIMQTNTNS